MGRYIWAPSLYSSYSYKQRCTLDVIGSCCCAWTVPTGITTVTFEIWGNGGNGGSHCCCYCSMSTAGAGGGFSLATVSTTAGCVYTICAGYFGTIYYCSPTATGCHGCPSYVTGYGLSNFCANGGGGGYSQYGCCEGTCVCCDGQAFGGNVNLNGGWIPNKMFMDYICEATGGGPSPMGGGISWQHAQSCCPYFSCGFNGMFPGGGGSGSSNCCCDCCGCSGLGAPGMVRVTY